MGKRLGLKIPGVIEPCRKELKSVHDGIWGVGILFAIFTNIW